MRKEVGQDFLNIHKVYVHQLKKELLLPTPLNLLNKIGFGSLTPITVKFCCGKQTFMLSERTPCLGVQCSPLLRQKCLKSLEMGIIP